VSPRQRLDTRSDIRRVLCIEVRYLEGLMHKPTYEDVFSGNTMHLEVVSVQYDPKEFSYRGHIDWMLKVRVTARFFLRNL